jgi:CRP/FNR family transcriptional regulator, polysaccharide utilization system transcription regulator
MKRCTCLVPLRQHCALFGDPSVNFDSTAFIAEQELIDALAKRSASVSCAKDRVLFKQGESPAGLFILRKGKASLTMQSATGSVIMSIIAAPDSLLGLPALVGNEPYTLTAMALEGAELGYITREDFSSLMLSEPAIAMSVLRVLAAEVRTARHALSEF